MTEKGRNWNLAKVKGPIYDSLISKIWPPPSIEGVRFLYSLMCSELLDDVRQLAYALHRLKKLELFSNYFGLSYSDDIADIERESIEMLRRVSRDPLWHGKAVLEHSLVYTEIANRYKPKIQGIRQRAERLEEKIMERLSLAVEELATILNYSPRAQTPSYIFAINTLKRVLADPTLLTKNQFVALFDTVLNLLIIEEEEVEESLESVEKSYQELIQKEEREERRARLEVILALTKKYPHIAKYVLKRLGELRPEVKR